MSSSQPLLRRRKLRKGTFSCLECKHRKTRCVFRPGDSICELCRHRGVSCLSQDFEAESNAELAERRVVHIEELVGQLVRQRNGEKADMVEQRAFLIAPDPSSECSVSSYLYSIFPSASTAAMIQERGISRSMLACLGPGRDQPWQILERPPSSSHPIHFARKLVQLALCLQQQKDPTNDAARYIGIVSRLVTSQDMLLDSIDGIETLMLEAMYHMNDDNTRAAWLLFRRALAIAQMLGLDSMQDSQRACVVWFWLIRGDRYFSLDLGLPVALTDNSFADLHSDPRSDLENAHAVIAGRIIERNQRLQKYRDSEYEETLDIDSSLKLAANSYPPAWWTFRVSQSLEDEKVIELAAKLLTQMHHYCLVLTLHQPYLRLELCSPESNASLSYNKMVIPPASREVLLRFLVLRSFHHGIPYRAIEVKAYKASIALLLAHIDGHRLGRANILEHMRPRDLGVIDDVINLIDEVGGGNNMVRKMKELVKIESEVANGATYEWLEGNGSGPQFELPFFGALRAIPRSSQGALLDQDIDSSLNLTTQGRMPGYEDLNDGNYLPLVDRNPDAYNWE